MQAWLDSLNVTWSSVIWGVVIFLITFTGSIALVSYLLVRLPVTYFQHSHPREFWTDRRRTTRWAGLVGKNILGLIFVALGIIMSVPGVPGQGILTILLGVMLLDFPGKRRLEYKLVSRPKVFRTINQLRERFGRPPLLLDD